MQALILEYIAIDDPNLGCFINVDSVGFMQFCDQEINERLVPYNVFAFKAELEMVTGKSLRLNRALHTSGESYDIDLLDERYK